MILRETTENFTFITQHDHANLAGEFFINLKKDFVPLEHYESLKFAIYQHDRSWIVPDAIPVWNDFSKRPFDFTDYPENLKFHFYRLGIEQLSQANSYAALLCSMHYSSFIGKDASEEALNFKNKELQRQKHLKQRLKIENDSYLTYQLSVLKLCDDLSLFVCLNKPGADKKNVHPFYAKGFPDSAFFNEDGENNIFAHYTDRQTVKFNSFPFEQKFELKLTLKTVEKKEIEELGLATAFEAQPWLEQTVKFG